MSTRYLLTYERPDPPGQRVMMRITGRRAVRLLPRTRDRALTASAARQLESWSELSRGGRRSGSPARRRPRRRCGSPTNPGARVERGRLTEWAPARQGPRCRPRPTDAVRRASRLTRRLVAVALALGEQREERVVRAHQRRTGPVRLTAGENRRRKPKSGPDFEPAVTGRAARAAVSHSWTPTTVPARNRRTRPPVSALRTAETGACRQGATARVVLRDRLDGVPSVTGALPAAAGRVLKHPPASAATGAARTDNKRPVESRLLHHKQRHQPVLSDAGGRRDSSRVQSRRPRFP